MKMRTQQSGATIVVVISVMATLAIFTAAALDYTFTMARNVERSNKLASEAAIANGCLQQEFMYWREVCRSSATQGPSGSAFANVPLPTQAEFSNISNFTATTGSGSSYTVSNYGITALNPQLQAVASSASPIPAIGMSGSNLTYFYKATATINMPDRGANVQLNANQIFEQQYQNPWQWAIFYVDPLEIHPGAPFTIDGWVQTNSSLWTAMSDLTFGGQVTYGTTWNIGFMPSDGGHNGDVPASPSWQSGLPPQEGTPTANPFGLNSSVFNTTDSNPNNNGYAELIQVPNTSYTDPLSEQRYFDNAGVKVLLNSSGSTVTATIYDQTSATAAASAQSTPTNTMGTIIGTITANGGSTGTPHPTSGNSAYQNALVSTISGALTFNQSIQDARQAATVALTQVDVGSITTAMTTGTLSTFSSTNFNHVIYIADQSASATNQRAIELTDGAQLPSGGLTFASQNPVYVVGDYNTGGSYSAGTGPPSDYSSSSQSTATGYTRQPASIIGDAVDILSNAWTNAESTNTESSRVAVSTTVNSAIMSGNVPTGTDGNNYSGGAENFPRFLENWSGATFTYYGSMVELFASQQATGIWGESNVYNPPTRAWHFDTNFQLHPPPGSIMIVTYNKGQWYQN
jgi:Tfp pilus assembly protein PilE